jgi:hypothetical protein
MGGATPASGWRPVFRRAVRRQGPLALILALAVIGADTLLDQRGESPPAIEDENWIVETIAKPGARVRRVLFTRTGRLFVLRSHIIQPPVRVDFGEIRQWEPERRFVRNLAAPVAACLDAEGRPWILDGARLARVDPDAGTVAEDVTLDREFRSTDLVVDTAHRVAYMTGPDRLIVADLRNGSTRTMRSSGLACAGLRLALSSDGRTLWLREDRGPRVWRVETDALDGPVLSAKPIHVPGPGGAVAAAEDGSAWLLDRDELGAEGLRRLRLGQDPETVAPDLRGDYIAIGSHGDVLVWRVGRDWTGGSLFRCGPVRPLPPDAPDVRELLGAFKSPSERYVVAPAQGYSFDHSLKRAREWSIVLAEPSLREALDDMERRSAVCKKPDVTGFRLGPGCVVISAEQHRKLLKDPGPFLKTFRQAWPREDITGLLEVSALGSSRDGRTAVIYVGKIRGPLAGRGGIYVFRLVYGRWRCVTWLGWWVS